jgi:hypothetical protein
MRLKPIQLGRRPAMRWPSIASLDHTAPGTAKSRQPHRGTAEKRRDPMLAVVLHATNTATDSAIRPANNSMLPGLSGNQRLLQTRQHQFSFGHRQPQIGDVTEIARAGDLRDVNPLLLTIGPDFYQPHNPSHTSTPTKTGCRVIPLSEHTPNHETASLGTRCGMRCSWPVTDGKAAGRARH